MDPAISSNGDEHGGAPSSRPAAVTVRRWQMPATVASDGLPGAGVAAAMELGGRLVGMPLHYAPTVALLPRATEPGAPTAGFVEDLLLTSAEGEAVGVLRAAAPFARPAFRPAERAVLDDVATVIAADHAAHAALGRIDAMTLRPNRQSFLADVGRLPANGTARLIVLVTLADAKQFNEILRALGHACAEDFVREGGHRIAARLGPATRLYHVSILSFAFVLEGVAPPAVPEIAPDLAAAFRTPILCRGIPITVRIGIGMSALPAAPLPAAEALRAALTAAQDSRHREQPWSCYDRQSDEAHQRAFSLLNDLEAALAAPDQLHLAFQPRVHLASGRTRSAEALIRWTHPILGPVSPGEFVPLAEATALVTPLTEWVVRHAAKQAAAWRRDGIDLTVSLNVAPANLRERSFAADLAAVLDAEGLDHADMEIEITEGTATSGESEVMRQLEAIRAAGMTIAIDDFGTGYSNLSYLTHLPASVLKIDQSFIRPLETDPRRQLVVRAIIDMAHGLDFKVVAEGIETSGTYAMLSGWTCDEGQGYHMSRPLGPEALASWLVER